MFTAIHLARNVKGGAAFFYGLLIVAGLYLAGLLLTREGRTKKGFVRGLIGLAAAALPVDVGWQLAFLEYAPGFEAGAEGIRLFPAFLLCPLFYALTFLMVRLLNDMFAE